MLIPFKEILEKYDIKPKGILHIGAYDGIEFEQYIEAGIDNVVFIEAQKSIMPTLLGRIKGYPNAKALNYCVSDRIEEVVFNVTNNGQSSSTLDLDEHLVQHPEIYVIEQNKMVAYPIELIFGWEKGLDISKYDMVVCDLQGQELAALRGMRYLLDSIKFLYLECNIKHLYKGCPLLPELDEFINTNGFTRLDTVFTKHYWGDLFAAKLEHI